MYGCTFVCMYVCMYVRVYVRNICIMYIYICMYISMYVWMYVCILPFCRGFRGLISGFESFVFFTVRGRQPLAQPPTWRTRVSLLAWINPFDLSGLGDPTSSYATAGHLTPQAPPLRQSRDTIGGLTGLEGVIFQKTELNFVYPGTQDERERRRDDREK
jgi:hypothetical protein